MNLTLNFSISGFQNGTKVNTYRKKGTKGKKREARKWGGPGAALTHLTLGLLSFSANRHPGSPAVTESVLLQSRLAANAANAAHAQVKQAASVLLPGFPKLREGSARTPPCPYI
jgi:hypothetical protein